MKIIAEIKVFSKKQIFDIKKYGTLELFRKFNILIRILIRVPIDIIAVAPCLIIRLVKPWLVVRIQEVPSASFGCFVEMIGIYYCKKKLKIDKLTNRHLDLFYIQHKNKIFNKQLAKMWKRKMIFLSSYLLDPIYKINKLIPGWKNHIINISDKRDIDNLFEKYKVLDFTAEEEIYGKKILNKFGLKDGDKFVCLAVSDRAYHLKKIPARYRDWSYHNFRHTNIDNFILAAEELAKIGYYVFRMGVVVEKLFNSKNPKIIDYANSNLRNDFMDIYLGAKCSFCISTSYGFQSLPCLFGKPIIDISSPIGDMCTHNEKYLLMTKHHILKKEKRKLSLSEIFFYGVAQANDTKTFEQKGIELVDNTPEEIKDIVLEMVESLKAKKELNQYDEELQKTFKSLYDSNIKNYQPNYGKFHRQIKSRYSTKFLRENKNWLR